MLCKWCKSCEAETGNFCRTCHAVFKVRVVNLKTWTGPVMKVDRTTRFGNPFKMEKEEDRETVLTRYERFITSPDQDALLEEFIRTVCEEEVEHIGCHCAPKRCHAELLIYAAKRHLRKG